MQRAVTPAGNKSKSKGTHKAETKGNGGDLHQAKTGTNQVKNGTKDSSKSKNKTETEGSHKAETKCNGGDLHQAKKGIGENTKAKNKTENEGGKDLQVKTRTR